jgi:hypothetical protein
VVSEVDDDFLLSVTYIIAIIGIILAAGMDFPKGPERQESNHDEKEEETDKKQG